MCTIPMMPVINKNTDTPFKIDKTKALVISLGIPGCCVKNGGRGRCRARGALCFGVFFRLLFAIAYIRWPDCPTYPRTRLRFACSLHLRQDGIHPAEGSPSTT